MQSYLLDCKIVYNAVILQLQLMHMTILIVVVVIKLHPPILHALHPCICCLQQGMWAYVWYFIMIVFNDLCLTAYD